MSLKNPIPLPPPRLVFRRLSRPALLLHLALLGWLFALTSILFPEYGTLDAILVGAAPYFTWSAIGRPLLTRHHRAGIRFLRDGRFDEAIDAFGKSRDFFTRHPALDRYRFFILMSAAAASYRELAFCNIAYAHARSGNIPAALEACDEALAAFPQSEIARSIKESLPAGMV